MEMPDTVTVFALPTFLSVNELPVYPTVRMSPVMRSSEVVTEAAVLPL